MNSDSSRIPFKLEIFNLSELQGMNKQTIEWINKVIIYIITVLIKYKKDNIILNTRFVPDKYRHKKRKRVNLKSLPTFKRKKDRKKGETLSDYIKLFYRNG